ncbi:MAG: DMT family transporter [Emergencia sp.]
MTEEKSTDIIRDRESVFSKTWALVLFALIACALWGSAFPGVKTGYEMFGIETTGSRILFAGYRFTAAGIITLIIVSVFEGRFVTIKKSSVPYIFAQGMLQTTVQYVLFYIGLANTTGIKGSVIDGSSGFFSIIAAHFILRNEKMSFRKVAGCVIGFAGVVVVNLESGGMTGGFALNGELLVLLSTIAYAVSSVTQKLLSSRETPNAITAYQLIFGGIVLILIGLFTGGSVKCPDFRAAALFGYLVLLSTAAFTLWANLLKHNPVGKVAIFGFTIPVFGSIFSAIFLKESFFTVNNILALVLVCIGIVIVNYEKGTD